MNLPSELVQAGTGVGRHGDTIVVDRRGGKAIHLVVHLEYPLALDAQVPQHLVADPALLLPTRMTPVDDMQDPSSAGLLRRTCPHLTGFEGFWIARHIQRYRKRRASRVRFSVDRVSV